MRHSLETIHFHDTTGKSDALASCVVKVVKVGTKNICEASSKLCDRANDRSFSVRNKPLERLTTRPIE